MMFLNNNRQQNPYYSETIRHRLEFMRQNADKLFSLGWLRKRLWKELCVRLPELNATEYGDYAQLLHGYPEIRFILEFLSVYKKSLPEIRTIIGNPYDTKAPIIDLLEKREVFIEEFAHIPFSDGWECVKNDNQSWRSFARRLYTKAQEDMTHFFEVLDMISIITDIVCKRASEYGLNVDYSPLKDYDLEQHADDKTAQAEEAAFLDKLSLCFKNNDEARRFLTSIREMNNIDTVRLAKKYRDCGRCTDISKNLWKLLYDAGLYKAGYQNWNNQMNKK